MSDDEVCRSSLILPEAVEPIKRESVKRKRSVLSLLRHKSLSTPYVPNTVDPDKPIYVEAHHDQEKPKQTISKEKPRLSKRKLSLLEKMQKNVIFRNRTACDWCRCLLFYFGLYFGLIASLIMFLAIHLFTGIISRDIPKLANYDSAMALVSEQTYENKHYYGNPALSFRPLNYDDSNVIWFVPGPRHPETWAPLAGNLDSFLDQYHEHKQYGCRDCTDREYKTAEDLKHISEAEWRRGIWTNKYCCFYVKQLGRECIKKRAYGFVEGRPCILLKLNRIYNWMPLLYRNVSEAPEEIKDRWSPDHIGVRCFGVNPPDKEHIGDMKYYPDEGFPFYYYPYHNQIRYRSPLVFVQFLNATPGVLVMVECRAYAKNIEIDGSSMIGSVRFELLIDISMGSGKKSVASGMLYRDNGLLAGLFGPKLHFYQKIAMLLPFVTTALRLS